MTAPKLPEGLEPVAFARKWWADGEKAVKVNGKWPGKFKLHAVTERQCLPDDAPLVRLSDAQAALQALAAEKRPNNAVLVPASELRELQEDAARYRWIRSNARGKVDGRGRQEFDLPDPHPLGNIMRGSVAQHLDAAIDSAIALAAKEAK